MIPISGTIHIDANGNITGRVSQSGEAPPTPQPGQPSAPPVAQPPTPQPTTDVDHYANFMQLFHGSAPHEAWHYVSLAPPAMNWWKGNIPGQEAGGAWAQRSFFGDDRAALFRWIKDADNIQVHSNRGSELQHMAHGR